MKRFFVIAAAMCRREIEAASVSPDTELAMSDALWTTSKIRMAYGPLLCTVIII
jgi:hypothetical protein